MAIQRQRSTGGFTLIELLITLAVITILVSVGVPAYGKFSENSAVSSATAGLIGALNDARSRATSERTPIRIGRLDGDWTNGWETIRLRDGALLFSSQRNADGRKVQISEKNSAAAIDFDIEGRTGSAITFNIAIRNGDSGSPMRTLAMNSSGRITVDSTPHP